ncbi:unnamed protein product [Pylaiella littoralis]
MPFGWNPDVRWGNSETMREPGGRGWPPHRGEIGAERSSASKCRQGFSRLYTWSKHRHGINSAAVLLTLALVLEFLASLLAFTEAVQAGALQGDVDCSAGGRLESLHRSERVQNRCTKMDEPGALDTSNLSGDFLNFGCEPTEAPIGEDSFSALCSCPAIDDDPNGDFFSASSKTEDCVWAGVEILETDLHSTSLDGDTIGLCLAKTFYLTSPLFGDDEYYTSDRLLMKPNCWENNTAGTATITIAAFVVAVVGQLVEGFVGWRYFKNSRKGPALMTAGSVFEAAGVVAISITLINLPSFAEAGEVWVTELHSDQQALYGLAIAGATCAGLGALTDIISGYLNYLEGRDIRSSWNTRLCRMFQNDRTRKQRIYSLGAFGGALIWLGTAVVEVVVATFLVWKNEGKARLGYDEGDWGVFGTSLLGLLVTEVLALFAMWAARVAWTRAKLRILLEPRELPRPTKPEYVY